MGLEPSENIVYIIEIYIIRMRVVNDTIVIATMKIGGMNVLLRFLLLDPFSLLLFESASSS